MIKEIKIAARLYEIRDTAKRFFKEEFKSKLEPYTALILVHMKKSGKDELCAAMDLLQLESVQGNGMAQMLFIAAVVEMIEPS